MLQPNIQNQPQDGSTTQDPAPSFTFFTGVAAVGDFLVIVGCMSLAYALRFFPTGEQGLVSFDAYLRLIFFGALLLMTQLLLSQIYSNRTLLRFREASGIILKYCSAWFFLFLALSLVFRVQPPISRLYVVVAFLTVVGGLLVWRYMLSRVLMTESFARYLRQKVLVIGWNEKAMQLYEAIWADRERHYTVVGCLTFPDGEIEFQPPAKVPRLGTFDDLSAVIQRYGVDTVVSTDMNLGSEKMIRLMAMCEREMVGFKVMPSPMEFSLSGLHLESIQGIPIVGFDNMPLTYPLNRIIKRTVDIFGALVGLVAFAPLIAVFGYLVHRESPGPIFYPQVRMGRKGRNFKIYKIRSMRIDAERTGAQWAVENDPRRLKIGAFMRKYNIDELPQFWNVLKGEMSLVGPRPERPELIRQFREKIPRYNARHNVKPGLTGWAQINGLRGNTDLTLRVIYDLQYIENWNAWWDFVIMAKTLKAHKNAY